MNIINNKKIAIVGGGPGGLTLARLLQISGADVTVYERDAHKDARAKGATLDLHEESGLLALKEAGLTEAFKANFRPGAELMRIMNKHADIVMEDTPTTGEEIRRPEIDRGPLQEILLESLAPGTVVWNSHFTGLVPESTGWRLEFKNSPAAFADIVVAADGANSKVRPYITPLRPFYSGITAVEGSVYNSATASPVIHKLLNGGKIFALDEGKTLIVSSKGDGSLMFYASCKQDEAWHRENGINFSDKAQVLDWFTTTFAGWNEVYRELFKNAEIPFVTRPIYCMPIDQAWETLPNITMLGDAAHLMPPFAGEGVNMAMLDALELANTLVNGGFHTVYDAIAAYEKEMIKRGAAAAKDSLDSGDAMHSADGLNFLLGVVG